MKVLYKLNALKHDLIIVLTVVMAADLIALTFLDAAAMQPGLDLWHGKVVSLVNILDVLAIGIKEDDNFTFINIIFLSFDSR